MTKSTRKPLGPSTIKEVAKTNWLDAESVKALEQTTRTVFEAFMVGHEDTETSRTRVRNYVIGAFAGAFPRPERQDVRAKLEELVVRVTRKEPSNRAFRVGDKIVIERFYGHACTSKDKPIHTVESRIVRETPTRWVLAPDVGRWIDKRTNIVKPKHINYLDRARLAEGVQ